jgi:IS5 family transposase
MNKQTSLSALNDELAQVRTKRKEFLVQIERIIPLGEWLALIQPCYYKGERGNKPYPMELMLRPYLLQNLYTLSDEATVAEAIDSRAFSEFCGVDSTLIAAPSSTKNREKQRDPDAHQTKKGNQWYFGYKAHIGVDKDSGLVQKVKVTAANVSDVTPMPELLTGEDEVVYGDSGYLGAEKREEAILKNRQGKKIRYKINRRPSQIKNRSLWS